MALCLYACRSLVLRLWLLVSLAVALELCFWLSVSLAVAVALEFGSLAVSL